MGFAILFLFQIQIEFASWYKFYVRNLRAVLSRIGAKYKKYYLYFCDSLPKGKGRSLFLPYHTVPYSLELG